ncbi:hypothetical protein HanRHA438_Chr08g0363931 [Helianthus annuus]|nr:hypothetical protein HanHA300_Chr08g0290251 [Helianthus annuus]KAJ0548073.1 hypothetical protein HanIR_Chr08g0379371 [Helianthus annuus]KAJ0554507.1 hypothetical protein HanHA89_Chr08g0308631 [Helianthus annuus]KAJ0899057.1 hypothetical protein HanRHA438_Chr08g0363931 [Helianthus annuus]
MQHKQTIPKSIYPQITKTHIINPKKPKTCLQGTKLCEQISKTQIINPKIIIKETTFS